LPGPNGRISPPNPDGRAEQLDANLAAYKDRLVRIAGLIERMSAVPVFVTQTRADYRLEKNRLTGTTSVKGPNRVDQGRALGRFNAATLEMCRDRQGRDPRA
jgi:hypothetical protein